MGHNNCESPEVTGLVCSRCGRGRVGDCKTYHLSGSLSMSLIHSAVKTSKLSDVRLYQTLNVPVSSYSACRVLCKKSKVRINLALMKA